MSRRECRVGDVGERWRLFREFVGYELAAGGPDPHMKIATRICEDIEDPVRRAWFIGCYIGPYNVPTGETIYEAFPDPSRADESELAAWLKANWHGLVVRRERRPVMAPHKLAANLASFAEWLRVVALEGGVRGGFEEQFARVGEVRYNGRYATMKLYEALRRAVPELGLELFKDIRPAGGWSPRLALSWLFPGYTAELRGTDAPLNLAVAQQLAARARNDLFGVGISLDWFNTEVMLCDFKQALDGKQYPGRAHDSELAHWFKVREAFPDITMHTLPVRLELFPHWALGEVGGWEGRRPLGELAPAYGLTWSDQVYDYHASDPETGKLARR